VQERDGALERLLHGGSAGDGERHPADLLRALRPAVEMDSATSTTTIHVLGFIVDPSFQASLA
jgi:hypothetical protein